MNCCDSIPLTCARRYVSVAAGLAGCLIYFSAGLPPVLAQGRPEIAWIASGHTETVNSVAYSPDGRQLAYGRYDATLALADNPFGPDACRYRLTGDFRPKHGCRSCPMEGGLVTTEQGCDRRGDCERKFRTQIVCPDGGRGFCKKVKGKRSGCESVRLLSMAARESEGGAFVEFFTERSTP